MDITRRKAALAAMSAPLAMARAEQKKAAGYGGALEKFHGRYDPAAFDSRLYALARYGEMERALKFEARSPEAARKWQKKLAARLRQCMGHWPDARGDLRAQTLERKDLGPYTREALMFESRPGLAVFAYLLVPKGRPEPHPVVICLPGHGRGVDDICGIDEQGRERSTRVGYEYDFAVQVVEHGMAALAIEMLGFGCRRDQAARDKGAEQSSCQPAAGAALLLGETMAAWRTWDVMRACDWIVTRQELDATRIGCMGISGGGSITLYATALEPRIRAGFISCALCSYRDSILSIAHCIDNYIPGLLRWAESSDVAALIAPRPLFVESGLRDTIFPIAASRQAYQDAKRAWEVMGAPELIGREEFDAPHEFHGVQGLEFLRRHLSA